MSRILRLGGPRLLTLVLAAVLSCVTVVGLAGPAAAHAVLDSSSPQDGARLEHAPATVTLTFDEAVQPIPASDEVISATGVRVDTGRLTQSADGTTIVLPLRPDLPTGTYAVTWRVVSADTHIVGGSITFGVGVDPSAAPVAPPDRARALDVTADAGEGLLYLGIVLLVGVAAAAAALWPWALAARRTRLLMWAGWLLTVLGTILPFLLQGPRAENESWSAVWRFADAGQTLDSAFGRELLARLLLLVVVAPLLTTAWAGRLQRRRYAVAGGTLAVALLVTVALTGHEAVGSDVPAAMISAVLHLAAMAVWLGGLAVLLTIVLPAARSGGIPLGAAGMTRWSCVAYCCVACLVLTGEFQASRQIDPVEALWSTGYGVVLLVKLAVIGLVLVAAAVAQRRVLTGGDVRSVVRRSVRIEAGLAVVVLAVTALLVSEPPGNTTYGPPSDMTAPLGPDTVHVHVDGTRRGRQSLELTVTDAAGRPAPVQAITASLSSTEVAALAVTLAPDTGPAPTTASARWHSTDAVVPLPGPWTLALDVTVDSADAYSTAAHYRVY
ncbi:copper resistance protein CopC [Pseudonocardia xinjiangensis]|uniref:copper resistance CopC/CopD family protein n=1 Tax=Pseudonocardia xinjiangensis TaxID=75289 RepID=UPI003D91E3FB